MTATTICPVEDDLRRVVERESLLLQADVRRRAGPPCGCDNAAVCARGGQLVIEPAPVRGVAGLQQDEAPVA